MSLRDTMSAKMQELTVISTAVKVALKVVTLYQASLATRDRDCSLAPSSDYGTSIWLPFAISAIAELMT